MRKESLALFALTMSGFLSQSVGYDLYHHTYSVVLFSQGDLGKTYLIPILDLEVPRYILGYLMPSLLYKLGIPPFFGIFMVFFLGVLYCSRLFPEGKRTALIYQIFIAYSSWRFSMLAWSLIFLFPLIVERGAAASGSAKNWQLGFFAASLHPVGVFLVIVLSIPFRSISMFIAACAPVYLSSLLILLT